MPDAGGVNCPRCGRPKEPGDGAGPCLPCLRSVGRRRRARRDRWRAAVVAAIGAILLGGLWVGTWWARDRAGAARPDGGVQPQPARSEPKPAPASSLHLPAPPPDAALVLQGPVRYRSPSGEPGDPYAELREAVRLRPDFARAHLDLGRMLANRRKPAEAIAEFRAAIRAESDLVEAYSELVALLREVGSPEDWVAWKRTEFDLRAAAVSAPMSAVDIITLKGHGEAVHSASFSPDGSRIATGSLDGTVKIWDARP